MSAQILDGKLVAADLLGHVAGKVDALVAAGHEPPGLDAILVGDDPASQIYVRNKLRACERTGITSREHRLAAETSVPELIRLIDDLNRDPQVDGILLQLPLPGGVDADPVLARIDPGKDVDGFHACNLGRLVQARPGLRPCTPRGIMRLLEANEITCEGMEAVVVGASNIVGRPMALELLAARATVSVCNSRTRELERHVRRAELLVVAVGRPGLIPGDWIHPGAIVVDVGINRTDRGKLTGDVDFARARERAAWITPVPGGVGPMTVATLMDNTVEAARAHRAGA
ncbi:MAG: bifunctional methylenetetrahydrofolate dehydrogenase/methenyltetrahydrofolate cyclohydrolase FolD [Gammaproteobacteria bacterium]|nr:bifunctional methylenetetrahydrofolate dehydrogenase/methenyltetrahydrofolate cyclohydrolase FolD [Gammaproteobacteria bacterium]